MHLFQLVYILLLKSRPSCLIPLPLPPLPVATLRSNTAPRARGHVILSIYFILHFLPIISPVTPKRQQGTLYYQYILLNTYLSQKEKGATTMIALSFCFILVQLPNNLLPFQAKLFINPVNNSFRVHISSSPFISLFYLFYLRCSVFFMML